MATELHQRVAFPLRRTPTSGARLTCSTRGAGRVKSSQQLLVRASATRDRTAAASLRPRRSLWPLCTAACVPTGTAGDRCGAGSEPTSRGHAAPVLWFGGPPNTGKGVSPHDSGLGGARAVSPATTGTHQAGPRLVSLGTGRTCAVHKQLRCAHAAGFSPRLYTR